MIRHYCTSVSILCVLLTCAPALGDQATAAPAAPESPYFTVEELAPGVLLFRPDGPGPLRANSLVVQREGEVLVIDAQPTTEAARLLLERIPRHANGPVRYLVLSHAHAEAAGGAAAYPPETVIVASHTYRDALADPELDYGAEAHAVMGAAWVEPPRTQPDIVITNKTEIAGSMNPVNLVPLTQAHAPGDLLVELPAAGLVYAGGLVFPDGNPYASSATVGSWISVLTYLIDTGPEKFVGVRGRPVVKHELRRQRDALAWLQGQVEQGFADMLPLERIAERVLGEQETGQRFNAQVTPSFLPRLVRQVIEESAEHRRKRGRPVAGDVAPSQP